MDRVCRGGDDLCRCECLHAVGEGIRQRQDNQAVWYCTLGLIRHQRLLYLTVAVTCLQGLPQGGPVSDDVRGQLLGHHFQHNTVDSVWRSRANYEISIQVPYFHLRQHPHIHHQCNRSAVHLLHHQNVRPSGIHHHHDHSANILLGFVHHYIRSPGRLVWLAGSCHSVRHFVLPGAPEASSEEEWQSFRRWRRLRSNRCLDLLQCS
mmetsp:Transcript_39466/g.71852  ORF Transcript_39466/g.71852 Transcript_39466/m.71852 type:complete len:206 (+) Transcript_39466:615-1232(+)